MALPIRGCVRSRHLAGPRWPRRMSIGSSTLGSRMAGRQVRTWAWVAFAAQVLLVVGWIVAGFWQGPRYSVLADSISVMFAGLSVCPSLRAAGASAAIGSVLLGLSIYGLVSVLTPFKRVACRIAEEGCSPGDQLATTGGRLDLILSTAGIALFIGAVFFLSAAMARTPDWRYLARPGRWVGIAFVVLLVASALAFGAFGLANRVLAITGAAAIAGLAWQIARTPPKTSS